MAKLNCSLLCAMLVLFTIPASAQKKCKKVTLYAFERTTLPGIMPGGVVDEQGREVERKSSVKTTRYIYLEMPARLRVSNIRIWINGVAHEAVATPVETPIIIGKTTVGNRERSDTLVAKSRFSVVRIAPGIENPIRKTGEIAEAVGRSEVVLEYTINGKAYYAEQGQIKKLEPLALQ